MGSLFYCALSSSGRTPGYEPGGGGFDSRSAYQILEFDMIDDYTSPVAIAIVYNGMQWQPLPIHNIVDELRGFGFNTLIWLREPTQEELDWTRPIMTVKHKTEVHAYRVRG